MKEKRDRHSIKIDQEGYRRELAESQPDKKAWARFRRKPYQAGRLIRRQGEQIEHKTVAEYIAEKYKI